jgi:hypothetical protein
VVLLFIAKNRVICKISMHQKHTNMKAETKNEVCNISDLIDRLTKEIYKRVQSLDLCIVSNKPLEAYKLQQEIQFLLDRLLNLNRLIGQSIEHYNSVRSEIENFDIMLPSNFWERQDQKLALQLFQRDYLKMGYLQQYQ